jgi:uncharacterized protein (DUF58 family)
VKRSWRCNGASLLVTCCLLALFWIAGAYLGGWFRYVSQFFSVVLVLDLSHLLLMVRSIYYRQDFSTTRPQKGEDAEYSFSIRTFGGLPGCRITIRFKGLRSDIPLDVGLRDLDFFSVAGRNFKRQYRIRFPYRGVYRVGMESLDVHDILGLLVMRLPIWFETFRVYPRLIDLHACRLTAGGGRQASRVGLDGGSADTTQFKSLTEYRPGLSVRHLAWKKFAATGLPFLKEYDMASLPGATIYLDGERLALLDDRLLAAEDCSIETVLALTAYLIGNGVAVQVRTHEQVWSVGVDDQLQFGRFLQSTVDLHFLEPGAGGRGLLDLYRTDILDGLVTTSTVIGVFRSFDSRVIAFIEEYHSEQRHTMAVVIGCALDDDARRQLVGYLAESGQSERLVVVRSPDSIAEDLA